MKKEPPIVRTLDNGGNGKYPHSDRRDSPANHLLRKELWNVRRNNRLRDLVRSTPRRK